MSVYITSDTHFNHKKIIGYCSRPFSSVEEMNETIIERWNEKVNNGDIVIHLGDFAWGTKKQIRETRQRLNGMVLLLEAGHDRGRVKESWGFSIRRKNIQIGNYIFSHKPISLEEIPEGLVNVHGHIHEKESLYGLNVCVEKTGYSPVRFEELGALGKMKGDYTNI